MANASDGLPNKASYIIQLEMIILLFSKHTVRRKGLKTTSQFLVH